GNPDRSDDSNGHRRNTERRTRKPVNRSSSRTGRKRSRWPERTCRRRTMDSSTIQFRTNPARSHPARYMSAPHRRLPRQDMTSANSPNDKSHPRPLFCRISVALECCAGIQNEFMPAFQLDSLVVFPDLCFALQYANLSLIGIDIVETGLEQL